MKRFLLLFILYLASTLQVAAGVPCSLPFVLTNGTLADANQVMANYNALIACLANAAASGSNSDITALNALVVPITPGQGGTNVFIGGASTGAANAQIIATTTPNTFTLAPGTRVIFIAGFTNTAALQINVHSTGLVNVFRQSTTGQIATTGGEVVAGQLVEAAYDGTQFEILSTLPGLSGGFGQLVSLAGAGTTDLGTVPTHNVQVTGGATVTSFGSTASTTFPIYRLVFTSTTTLTNNNTSLILPGGANIITATNDAAVAQYLGSGNWQIISYARANGASVINPTPLCGAVNWTAKNNAGTPLTNIDYSADSAVMLTTANIPFYQVNISGTINTTTGTVTPAADGMDGEARPTSAWGYVWLISNGINTNGLVSTTLSPTLPAGYIYKCRLAAMSFDASQNLFRMRSDGNISTYTLVAATNTANTVIIANGTVGTYSLSSPVLTATQVTGNTKCAPVTASDINVSVSPSWKGQSAGQLEVAPSTAWGGTNNGPAGTAGNVWPLVLDASQPNLSSSSWGLSAWIHLESNSVGYAASGTNTALGCLGYKDKVNAN